MTRAIRLVVDTGINHKKWTVEQATQYFHDHSSLEDQNVETEINRYISWPGQALGYKIGQLTFLRLRERAEQALGPAFSLAAFHDQCIDSGALPLEVLDDRISAWIKAERGKRQNADKTWNQ